MYNTREKPIILPKHSSKITDISANISCYQLLSADIAGEKPQNRKAQQKKKYQGTQGFRAYRDRSWCGVLEN